MLTLVSLGPPAAPPGRTDTTDPSLTSVEGFLDLLGAANPLASDITSLPEQDDGDVAADGDQPADDPDSAEAAAVDPALALFLGLPLIPVAAPLGPETASEGAPQDAGTQGLAGLAGLGRPGPDPALPLQADPAALPPQSAPTPETSKQAPQPKPGLAAPPALPAPDGATRAESGPEGPAPAPAPQLAGSAVESAARFRLNQSKTQGPEPETPLPATVDAGATDAGISPQISADTPPDVKPDHGPGAQPAAASPAPHRQTAAHLTQLVKEAGGQLTARHNHSELTLAPEELGRIRFDIRQHGDSLLVTLTADRPETLDLMRRSANDLRAELSAAGLGSATLDFGGSGSSRQPPSGAMPEFDLPQDLPLPAGATASPPPSLQRPALADGLDLRL